MDKFCKNCGNKLEEGAKYCSECGAKAETKATTGHKCPKCNSTNVTAAAKEYKPKLTFPLMLTFGGFGLMFLGPVGLVGGLLIGLVIGLVANCLVPQSYQTVITCGDCGYSGVRKEEFGKKK